MKKLLVALGIVLGLVVVAGLVASFFLGSIVKAGVNKVAPRITGTTVTLDSASISPWSGSGSLSGLFVGNPPGWTAPKLAYLGKVSLDVKPMSLLGDTIAINEVILEQPEFIYETKIVSSNVSDLLKQIEKNLGTDSTTPTAETKSGSAKKIAIKRLLIRNAKVTVGVGSSAVTVPMENLELTDLGTPENGLTSTQLIFAVSKQIVGNMAVAAAGALKTIGSSTGALSAEGVKKIGEGIKGIFKKDEPAKK